MTFLLIIDVTGLNTLLSGNLKLRSETLGLSYTGLYKIECGLLLI